MTDDRSSSRERGGKKKERLGYLNARPGRSNLRKLVKLGFIDPEDALDLEQDHYAELDNEREDDE